jgi:hypothetical protein
VKLTAAQIADGLAQLRAAGMVRLAALIEQRLTDTPDDG